MIGCEKPGFWFWGMGSVFWVVGFGVESFVLGAVGIVVEHFWPRSVRPSWAPSPGGSMILGEWSRLRVEPENVTELVRPQLN